MLNLDRCDWAWLVLVVSTICYVILCGFVLDPELVLLLYLVGPLLALVVWETARHGIRTFNIDISFRWFFVVLLALFQFYHIMCSLTSLTPLDTGIAIVVAVVVDAVIIGAISYVLRAVCRA